MSNLFAAGRVGWLFAFSAVPNLLRMLLVFCLCQGTAAFAREPDVTPEEVGLSSERLARFADYAKAMVEAGKIPGATIAVSRFSKLAYFETIGWADIDERKPTRSDTLYRLHSMTKPLFAVATMTLVEEGRLGLQDPISKYIPEFADVKVLAGGTADAPELEDPKTAPKVGQLLSQTAGIATGGDLFAEKTIAEIYSKASIHEGNPTAEEVAQRIARLPLAGHPGEVFVYGLSFDVLARVLEVASGQPLDDFIAERLLDPLGMEDTFFAVPEDKLHRFSNSYDITGPGSLQAVTRADHIARWRPGRRFLSPNGGMVSTVSDYLRFAQMMLGGGQLAGARIVSRKTIDLITATVVGNAELGLIRAALPGYGYSLGFGVLESVAESGKPGSLGQYEWAGWGDTYFFVDPKEQLIGLFFTQVYPGGTYGLRESLTSFTYQALID
ncbi:MAG: beta-lactamase family protein [Gammaproteobacteria bacterium]|nr:beta-lactamase family protein [Gammaproteobacteria bacterium]MYH16145.1 beta-lactamase family protein [Gammaproteobacteria bacterium]